MKRSTTLLTFGAVDGLAFAAAAGRLKSAEQGPRYLPASLGPLLELLYLAAGGRLRSPVGSGWLADNGAGPMISALGDNQESWVETSDRRMGFVRANRSTRNADTDTLLTSFLMDAQRAARNVAGLPGSTPGQLVAAMEELENNIHEHSDRGIGILKSLQRSSAFAGLQDHGRAIQAALSDGTSRFGSDSWRGHGFRPIFVGLANLQGSLRFRSGDHALLIDGTSPDLATAQLAQKPVIDGFLQASVAMFPYKAAPVIDFSDRVFPRSPSPPLCPVALNNQGTLAARAGK